MYSWQYAPLLYRVQLYVIVKFLSVTDPYMVMTNNIYGYIMKVRSQQNFSSSAETKFSVSCVA